jgi:hypothetical protein
MRDALFLAIGLVVFLGLVIWAAIADEQQWREFAAKHECRVVGKIAASSSTGTAIGTNGQVSVVPIYNPGKTGYQCNDGVTYWR